MAVLKRYITAFQKFEEPGTDDSLYVQLQLNGAYYPQFAADVAVRTVKFVHRTYTTIVVIVDGSTPATTVTYFIT